MTSGGPSERRVFLGAVGLFVLFAAGIVLATSWVWSYPAEVLMTAWLIAFAAMVTVVTCAFREARATGAGFFTSIGRCLKALGRFVFWFF